MRSGIVTIIGRPSAGKSTFLNTACGEKVSIVSDIPQTTRNAVRGIVNTNKGQIVFIDTPGYHASEKKFNKQLQEITCAKLAEADAILYLVDSSKEFGVEEESICALLSTLQNKIVIGLNKVDLPEAKPQLLTVNITNRLSEIPLNRFIQISAEKDQKINELLSCLMTLLPEGEPLYPPDFYTDQDPAFRITEIIREQAILHTREEVPHALYVGIEDLEMKKDGKVLWCRAFIAVDREGQKAMLIGKDAAVIKNIRITAIRTLRKIFPYKIDLDIRVKVDKNWRRKEQLVKNLLKS
ncbi:GTPase Era [Treponema phagedenis]|uniref:GTPase Era n=1 Tax=Treponema phagedenis TaxID=162 RepID=A0A0B7GUH5_TREPH|nr:GTPase Era [Treponema phagedenis]QEJ98861.1 GTPase Era [Treponema phagedenis]QSH94181.1 GTPase Era [Treponema phagedenis]QSH98545.1 GTPase Era [Treponema phagedenis]CEM61187.1 GTPase Era [Treponema phagedenis]